MTEIGESLILTNMKNHLEVRDYEALIDRLQPEGRVLQIEFSSGIAAERIQSRHPKHHTIIEPNRNIAEKAKTKPGWEVISGRWEKVLPALGSFDAIFYDDFKPEREREQAKLLADASTTVQKGKEALSKARARFPNLTQMKYSDSDLEQLFAQFGKDKQPQLAHFLKELLRNGQISQDQYEARGYGLEVPRALPPSDPILAFLRACLKNHMGKGSRFVCISSSPVSKFEDPRFFEEIITNPDYDYEEDVPFKGALVFVVIKQV